LRIALSLLPHFWFIILRLILDIVLGTHQSSEKSCMKKYLIGIDQGTTGTFVGMMDPEGSFIQHAYREHNQYYPEPDWVEHDPEEIWENICSLLNQVIENSAVDTREIAGIGIANQGESVVIWDGRTGQTLSNIIVWQDTRTHRSMNKISSDAGAVNEIRSRTGLRPDAYFSASKIRWLLENIPNIDSILKENQLRCGTLDSWLIWRLTEGRSYLTDVSTASRTLLFNIQTLDWDDWLLNYFGIPRSILATVVETVGDFGIVTHPDITTREIPIIASIVDQPAAMVGQGCLAPHSIKATFGTGCFVNLNTGLDPIISNNELLTLVAWQREGIPTYGLDGGVFSAGSSLNWLRDKANLIENAEEIDRLCLTVQDSGGVIWIPAQVGLGVPYWDRKIRGAWLGVDLSTERAHLVRAMLEGIALRVAQIINVMNKDSNTTISSLRVDGGLTQNETMMQLQADMLGFPVEVLENQESTAKGICSLAARYAGIWRSDEQIIKQVKVNQIYEPLCSTEVREKRLSDFDHAISALRDWPYEYK
jgi:glycerol kinase